MESISKNINNTDNTKLFDIYTIFFYAKYPF